MITSRLAAMLFAVSAAAPALAQSPTPPPARPPMCISPEHRQFDFWVGKWDVYPTGKDNLVAHSLIERLYAGCAIRENWMPLGGTGGGSLNSYRPDEGKWRQTWVDSGNTYGSFEGGLVDGAMVLTGLWKGFGGPGVDRLTRMTYTKGEDGTVRQQLAVSTDGGNTWTQTGDLTYRPAQASTE